MSPADHLVKEQVHGPVGLVLVVVADVERQEHPGVGREDQDPAQHFLLQIGREQDDVLREQALQFLDLGQGVGRRYVMTHAQVVLENAVVTGDIVRDLDADALAKRLFSGPAGVRAECLQGVARIQRDHGGDLAFPAMESGLLQGEVKVLVGLGIIDQRRLGEDDLLITLIPDMMDQVLDGQVDVVDAQSGSKDQAAVRSAPMGDDRLTVADRRENTDQIALVPDHQMVALKTVGRMIAQEFEIMEDRAVVRFRDEFFPLRVVLLRVFPYLHGVIVSTLFRKSTKQ